MVELLEDLCCYLKREGITLPDDMQKDLDQFAIEDDEMDADVIEIEPE